MPTTREVSGDSALGSAAHYPDARSMHMCVCARVHTHVHMHIHTHAQTHTLPCPGLSSLQGNGGGIFDVICHFQGQGGTAGQDWCQTLSC